MKRKLFSFSASVITAIMLTACAAAPENKPASSAALSPTSEAVATAIPSTSNANWKLPPQYDFDEMIPLFSRDRRKYMQRNDGSDRTVRRTEKN